MALQGKILHLPGGTLVFVGEPDHAMARLLAIALAVARAEHPPLLPVSFPDDHPRRRLSGTEEQDMALLIGDLARERPPIPLLSAAFIEKATPPCKTPIAQNYPDHGAKARVKGQFGGALTKHHKRF